MHAHHIPLYIDNRGVVQDYYYMHNHAKVLSSKHLEMIVLEVQLQKIADSEIGIMLFPKL